MNKWMTKALKQDNAVKWDYNPYAHVLRTGSPSFDYIYGKTHGLPMGYTEVLWGPPKSGKSILTYSKIGELHRSDPDAMVIKFNTEQREELQLTPYAARQWGIDLERYVVKQTQLPDEIFDYIYGELKGDLQNGAPYKYLIIDSVNDILGRRTLNADSVMTQQIGDDAKTLQDGLKMIKGTIRGHKLATTLIAQARAEMDPVEQMRGNKLKMAGAWALQHFAEYFIFVEQNKAKAGKQNLSGEDLVDVSKKDVMDHEERTGHKIRVTMKGNSTGVAGRVGELTLDYSTGIINTHEEAFLLGVGQGIVQRPNNTTYVFPDYPKLGENAQFRGKDNFLMALKENTPLKDALLKRVRMLDLDAMENGRIISGIMESSADAEENQLTDRATLEK